MKKILILVLVLTMVLVGCSTTSNKEVIKEQEQVVDQEGTRVVEEVVEELEEEIIEIEEEISGEVVEEEIIELEEVEEETGLTLEDFKGEYIEVKDENADYVESVVIFIEDDRFVLGFYASEGIFIENPVYTIEGEHVLIVEGLAFDGFDFTEYETSFSVEWVDENTIRFLGDSVAYELERM